jgi:hypothetical protein
VTYIRFFIDASGTTWPNDGFDVFMLARCPTKWWSDFAEQDGEEVFYIKGENHNYANYLVGYLDENGLYVFTWFTGQSCPLFEQQDGTFKDHHGCELALRASEMLQTAFDAFEPGLYLE